MTARVMACAGTVWTVTVGGISAQEQRYFEWTSMPFPAEEFTDRRKAFADRIGAVSGGVFLAPSIDGLSGGETFRQQDNFMYFTGLELPRSILAIRADGSTTLFAPRRDPRFENPSRPNDFPGRPLADDTALSEGSGIDDIRPTEQFEQFVAEMISSGIPLLLDMGGRNSEPPTLRPHLNWDPRDGFHFFLRSRYPEARLQNAYQLIAHQRMVKTPREIERMRQAARLTADAIATAAATVRDGIDERSLEGAFEAACKSGGSQRTAFSSIIKSGPNSLWPWRVLASHYDRRNRIMEDGDLVIFDVGCELDGYVSDVGRTFPISGSFTVLQRDILEMVTGIADTIIASIRPGTNFSELREIGRSAIPAAHRQYMMVGTFYGHHLGLSTGDPSLPDVFLHPGMVFTVEPWYYNHDLEIAVFIEEEILVTEDGAEILTSTLPRAPADLAGMVNSR